MGYAGSVHDVVVAALTEMGIPAASLVCTILLRNRYFVGHKFRFDGGYAIWWTEKNLVEIYDEAGKLLKQIATGADEKEAA